MDEAKRYTISHYYLIESAVTAILLLAATMAYRELTAIMAHLSIASRLRDSFLAGRRHL